MYILDPVKGDDIQTFLVRLTETVEWCSQLRQIEDVALVLRTEDIAPWWWANGRKKLIYSVADVRNMRRLIRLRKENNAPAAKDLAGGRLLWYAPDWNSQDGSSRHSTNGFFDFDSAPPWDTWIAYFYENNEDGSYERDYVVSWIPPDYFELVEEGIFRNSDACIGWLDEEKDWAGAQALQAIGLL